MENYHEPLKTFASWLKEVESNSQIIEPRAVNLAIVNDKNQPSSMMVLLTKFDEEGFNFSVNSSRGNVLNINQNVALCFYWGVLGKQVRIEGEIIDQKNLNQSLLIDFVVSPKVIEFWQEGKFRLHKRTEYRKTSNSWRVVRLYP